MPMSIRVILKGLVFGLAVGLVSPLIVLAWLEKRLSRSEVLFTSAAHFLSLMPGAIGTYLRGAYYFGCLDSCSWEVHIGFGSIFTHRGATVGKHVSTGVYCVIGHADIGSGVRLASRISIPSGKRQHFSEDGALADVTRFDRVAIGKGCWIGEGAIVVANVGEECVVSAGALVIDDAPARAIVGGNPAKVIKMLTVPGERGAS